MSYYFRQSLMARFRKEWNAAQHPRTPAGSSEGGQFALVGSARESTHDRGYYDAQGNRINPRLYRSDADYRRGYDRAMKKLKPAPAVDLFSGWSELRI